MSLALPNIVEIIEVMENYLEKIRPSVHIPEKLDITYLIENQSVILQEVRPIFQQYGKKMESGYAKATYIKSGDKWKVYWRRANLKWYKYEPRPEVKNLKEFVKLVEEDAHHCFKG